MCTSCDSRTEGDVWIWNKHEYHDKINPPVHPLSPHLEVHHSALFLHSMYSLAWYRLRLVFQIMRTIRKGSSYDMMALCTKLVQWLSVGGLLIAVWAALLTELLPVRLTPQLYEVVLPVSLQKNHLPECNPVASHNLKSDCSSLFFSFQCTFSYVLG